jgi:hypothetical protein
VIKEVPVYQTELKVVERIKEVPVETGRLEIEKPVDRIVEVPLIH